MKHILFFSLAFVIIFLNLHCSNSSPYGPISSGSGTVPTTTNPSSLPPTTTGMPTCFVYPTSSSCVQTITSTSESSFVDQPSSYTYGNLSNPVYPVYLLYNPVTYDFMESTQYNEGYNQGYESLTPPSTPPIFYVFKEPVAGTNCNVSLFRFHTVIGDNVYHFLTTDPLGEDNGNGTNVLDYTLGYVCSAVSAGTALISRVLLANTSPIPYLLHVTTPYPLPWEQDNYTLENAGYFYAPVDDSIWPYVQQ